jgi:hypothetical protein
MKLNIDNDVLQIRLNPLEIIFSQHGSLKVPLDHIVQASGEKPERDWSQIRAPGIHIPFLLKAGTYHGSKSREFWYATIGMPYLVIDLMNWDFDRIVLTMSDNQAWAGRINQAIQAPA